MKLSMDQKNKRILVIFLFIISQYFATMIHESGHAITIFIFGCKLPAPLVSPIIMGITDCLSQNNFWDNLNATQQTWASISGILFVGIIGILLFITYKFWRTIRKYYSLALIFYFSAFGCLLNGFLQSIGGGDVSLLINKLGLNRLYLVAIAVILGVFLLWQIFEFKNLLKILEPRITKKDIKNRYIIFVTTVLGIMIFYLFIPLLF